MPENIGVKGNITALAAELRMIPIIPKLNISPILEGVKSSSKPPATTALEKNTTAPGMDTIAARTKFNTNRIITSSVRKPDAVSCAGEGIRNSE